MSDYTSTNLAITAWAEADRPREKMMNKGRQALTNAELIAIILGSGSRNESAVSLAQCILKSVDNNLQELGRVSLAGLKQFNGVGDAKAISIAAALELGRRRQLTEVAERPKIQSSLDAYKVLGPLLTDLPHEEFWILLLNRGNKVIGREKISEGGTSGTIADAKIIFRRALAGQAVSIVLFHNHPSNNLRPSQPDIDLTKKLKEAGTALDIGVLDHLIIGDKGYYSFADHGMI